MKIRMQLISIVLGLRNDKKWYNFLHLHDIPPMGNCSLTDDLVHLQMKEKQLYYSIKKDVIRHKI